MSEFEERFNMNYILKTYARDYADNPNEDTMLDLLSEIVVRIEDGSEALVPMVVDGERIYYDTVSDGQNEWIPMYTDWDELTKEEPTEYTMSLPIRSIIEDAFDSRRAEGIVINLHSEEVCIGKNDLDWVLYVLAQREAC